MDTIGHHFGELLRSFFTITFLEAKMNGIKDKKHYTIDGIELFIRLDVEARREAMVEATARWLVTRYGIVDPDLAVTIVNDFTRSKHLPEKGAAFKETYSQAISNVIKWGAI